MLKLFTGVPGAGKTLNAIKHVVEQTAPGQAWENRPVYYFNIPEVVIDGWQELSDERVETWYTLPTGSIIILDEVQELYPPKDWKNGAEEGIKRLERHRHSGYDLLFITQHPKLLHTSVRRMVGEHWHFDRRHGMSRSTRYIWSSCEDDPKNYHSQQNASKESISFDKKIFNLYKSAEVHTHKRKIPKPLLLGILFLLSLPIIVLLVYLFFDLGAEPVEYDADLDQPLQQRSLNPIERLSNFTNGTPHDYAKSHQPREPGWPHTAPIYDDLREPVTYPKYNCIDFSLRPSGCKCYTQQTSLLATVPQSVCKKIIAEGFFDHALPDDSSRVQFGRSNYVPGQSGGEPSTVGGSPSQAVDNAISQVGSNQTVRRAILIEYNGPPRLRTGARSGQ